MKGLYKEVIVIARRGGQRYMAFPLYISAKETKEEALEKVESNIVDYMDRERSPQCSTN